MKLACVVSPLVQAGLPAAQVALGVGEGGRPLQQVPMGAPIVRDLHAPTLRMLERVQAKSTQE